MNPIGAQRTLRRLLYGGLASLALVCSFNALAASTGAGRAYGLQVTADAAGVGLGVPIADTGPRTAPPDFNAPTSVLSASVAAGLGNLLTVRTGVLNAATQSKLAQNSVVSSASVNGLALKLAGLALGADTVSSQAKMSCENGVLKPEGSAQILGASGSLVGVGVGVNTSVNLTIGVPTLGTMVGVVLHTNEQTLSNQGRTLSVNALRVELVATALGAHLLGASVVVGNSTATMADCAPTVTLGPLPLITTSNQSSVAVSGSCSAGSGNVAITSTPTGANQSLPCSATGSYSGSVNTTGLADVPVPRRAGQRGQPVHHQEHGPGGAAARRDGRLCATYHLGQPGVVWRLGHLLGQRCGGHHPGGRSARIGNVQRRPLVGHRPQCHSRAEWAGHRHGFANGQWFARLGQFLHQQGRHRCAARGGRYVGTGHHRGEPGLLHCIGQLLGERQQRHGPDRHRHCHRALYRQYLGCRRPGCQWVAQWACHGHGLPNGQPADGFRQSGNDQGFGRRHPGGDHRLGTGHHAGQPDWLYGLGDLLGQWQQRGGAGGRCLCLCAVHQRQLGHCRPGCQRLAQWRSHRHGVADRGHANRIRDPGDEQGRDGCCACRRRYLGSHDHPGESGVLRRLGQLFGQQHRRRRSDRLPRCHGDLQWRPLVVGRRRRQQLAGWIGHGDSLTDGRQPDRVGQPLDHQEHRGGGSRGDHCFGTRHHRTE